MNTINPEQPFEQDHATSAYEPSRAHEQLSGWERAKFILRALEVRLRFIGLFVGIALLMVYWRTIENHWDRWTRPANQVAAAAAGTEYYCPMHPNVIRPGLEPNGAVPSCPICGMPLSKRNKGEVPTLPEGITARVQLTPERVKLAGVATSTANYMPLSKEVRTVGYVEYDERRLSEIVTRVSGYIEKLYVDKTFTNVQAGEPLAEIYSPELYSSVQELLLAQKHASADLIASSRKRLKLFGISESEIDEILANDRDRPRLLIRSPQQGQVVAKYIVEGSSVEAGATLFKIADVSEVWIEADVFERDLPFLHEGQGVEVSVESFPGRNYLGQIELIYPELNRSTRTSRIRVALDNPELLLRPGMYATVLIKSPMSDTPSVRAHFASNSKPADASEESLIALQNLCPVTGAKLGSMGPPIKTTINGQTIFLCCEGCEKPLQADPAKYLAKLASRPEGAVLSIPESAVIDTGRSKVVYVEREPGLFEGVEVQLGPRAGGYYPVLEGLAPGDQVATAGSFLLDAETRLNPAAASAYFGASGGPSNGESSSSAAAGSSSRASKSSKQKQPSAADLENIAKLPPEDRELAKLQGVCPVTDEPLGSMGVPIKVVVKGQPIFVCCKGCVDQVRENPDKFLNKLKKPSPEKPETTDRSAAAAHRH